MTSLTLVTLAVMVYGAINRAGYGRALALGGATPVGAALVIGGIAVPTFYAVALGAAAGLLLRLARRSRRFERLDEPPAPGVLPLLLLVVWSLVVTLVAPLLFDGLPVLNPTGESQTLVAGSITHSNVAQTTYLVLGVCVVSLLSRSKWAGAEIVGTATGLAILLSFWSYLHGFGVPFPERFFDNSPFFLHIQTAPGGAERFRGIFSEPSGLGGQALVTIAYLLARIPQITGLRRLGAVVVLGLALFLGFQSTSTTFIVAGVVLGLIALLSFLNRFVLRHGPLSPLGMTTLCAGVVAALWYLPGLANRLGAAIFDKVNSISYSQRSGADGYSLHLAFQTFGLGTGLGSNRASSFVASMLSTIGVVGFLLLVTAIWLLVRGAWPVAAARPAVWALLALLVAKVIAGPDLGDTSGVLWMSLGVMAHAALAARRAARAARPVSLASAVALYPARAAVDDGRVQQ